MLSYQIETINVPNCKLDTQRKSKIPKMCRYLIDTRFGNVGAWILAYLDNDNDLAIVKADDCI